MGVILYSEPVGRAGHFPKKFSIMKNAIFASAIKWIWPGTCLEIGFFLNRLIRQKLQSIVSDSAQPWTQISELQLSVTYIEINIWTRIYNNTLNILKHSVMYLCQNSSQYYTEKNCDQKFPFLHPEPSIYKEFLKKKCVWLLARYASGKFIMSDATGRHKFGVQTHSCSVNVHL